MAKSCTICNNTIDGAHTRRKFCGSICAEGSRAVAVLQAAYRWRFVTGRPCTVCGEKLPGRASNYLYNVKEGRRADAFGEFRPQWKEWSSGRPECALCGAIFTPWRMNAIYCSKSCREGASAIRKLKKPPSPWWVAFQAGRAFCPLCIRRLTRGVRDRNRRAKLRAEALARVGSRVQRTEF